LQLLFRLRVGILIRLERQEQTSKRLGGLEVDYEKAQVAAMGARQIKRFEVRKSQERAAPDRPQAETTGQPERTTGRGGEE
jgi:hypothetical protein